MLILPTILIKSAMSNQFFFALLILITVALNTVAQTLLKLGAVQKSLNIYLLIGVGCYALSTIFYVLVLGKFNLSVAYPVVIGLTVATTAIAGIIIFNEKVSMLQLIGMVLLLSGITAIALAKPQLN
jgi:multidrug transporter EmrE-like cation transporter